MGYGTRLLILLACLSFTMLLVNAGNMWETWGTFELTFNLTNVAESMFGGIFAWATTVVVGIAIGSLLIGYLTGTNLLEPLMPYLVGGYILVLINDIFVIPISNFSTDSSVMIPDTLSLFIVVIFNIMLFGLAYSIIRGVDF
jgi:hypothetical protein